MSPITDKEIVYFFLITYDLELDPLISTFNPEIGIIKKCVDAKNELSRSEDV